MSVLGGKADIGRLGLRRKWTLLGWPGIRWFWVAIRESYQRLESQLRISSWQTHRRVIVSPWSNRQHLGTPVPVADAHASASPRLSRSTPLLHLFVEAMNVVRGGIEAKRESDDHDPTCRAFHAVARPCRRAPRSRVSFPGLRHPLPARPRSRRSSWAASSRSARSPGRARRAAPRGTRPRPRRARTCRCGRCPSGSCSRG